MAEGKNAPAEATWKKLAFANIDGGPGYATIVRAEKRPIARVAVGNDLEKARLCEHRRWTRICHHRSSREASNCAGRGRKRLGKSSPLRTSTVDQDMPPSFEPRSVQLRGSRSETTWKKLAFANIDGGPG